MAINLYYINGKWITLTGLLHYSCELIGLSPLTRQSANRPCKTKQNKEPNNDHQDFHNNFKGKKGPNLAALAAVEWNWKESPWGAGSVQIESTCWSLESELKGFVLFWLSCFIDTSYINLSKTLKKKQIMCLTGTTCELSWTVPDSCNDSMTTDVVFQSLCVGQIQILFSSCMVLHRLTDKEIQWENKKTGGWYFICFFVFF